MRTLPGAPFKAPEPVNLQEFNVFLYAHYYTKPHNGKEQEEPSKPSEEQQGAPGESQSWQNLPEVEIIKEPGYEAIIDLSKPEGSRLRIVELPGRVQQNFSKIYEERAKLISPCAKGFLKGECEQGHGFAKIMLCNKEYCPECGKKNSWIHKRRIARWWGNVLQMKTLGYLVLTIPEELRETYKDKKQLTELRTYAKRKLQREGYSRGLIRFHFAGDCRNCQGSEEGCKECNFTGASNVWAPHLNIFIEEGFLQKETLERWRKELATYFNKRHRGSLKKPVEGNLHYNYTRKQGGKVHKLKYVTRATWRFSGYGYEKETEVLKGFRVSSQWGKFQKSPEVRKSNLVHFVNNECPCCKTKIRWGGYVSSSDFLGGSLNLVHIEGGFYKYQKIEYSSG